MIVCSCNVFSDKDVRGCLSSQHPPATAREVYTALNCSPKCGCCARTITELLQEHRDRPQAKGTVAAPHIVHAA